jgi:hypothetical protein
VTLLRVAPAARAFFYFMDSRADAAQSARSSAFLGSSFGEAVLIVAPAVRAGFLFYGLAGRCCAIGPLVRVSWE